MQDLFILGTSYIGSSGVSTFLHVLGRALDFREKEAERRHARELASIKVLTREIENAQHNITDRDRTSGFWHGSFVGWTRRIIIIVICSMVVALVWGEIKNLPVNLVYKIQHNFLGFHWTNYVIYQLHGVVVSPFFRDTVSAMIGLYLGPATVQKFVRH